MNVAIDAPKRPALRYYGGKHNLAAWIISFFPEHINYVEPCGGAASILLQKPRAILETYNDLNGDVVNFFRVLRDCPDELIRRIRLTPWARAEYELSVLPCSDIAERARRFFMFSWMAIVPGLGHTHPGFRMQLHDKGKHNTPAHTCFDYESILMPVANRLLGVQIENSDWADVTTKYDHPDTLIYFDPPYIAQTRTNDEVYALEWCDEDHATAADLLRQCAGYVIVSGYACPLYADLYERHGWERHDKEAQTNSGGKRMESVWLSPRTVEALAKPRQGSLI